MLQQLKKDIPANIYMYATFENNFCSQSRGLNNNFTCLWINKCVCVHVYLFYVIILCYCILMNVCVVKDSLQPSSSLWSPQSLSPSHCHCAGMHVHSPNALTAHVKWFLPQEHSAALKTPTKYKYMESEGDLIISSLDRKCEKDEGYSKYSDSMYLRCHWIENCIYLSIVK